MQQNMSISVNGQSQVPPGFRFHPTEEELLQYYLRKKVCYEKIDLDVIRDVDLNKLEPWDIQEKCKIGTTPQNDWYFFSHKDKKYPTGTRTNRATAAGFWKATGRDKVICGNGKRIGMRKTLVFYKGRAPHGQKSDWIMHEYRLEDNIAAETSIVSNVIGDGGQEEGWVVCRIFKKKNHLKTLESPLASSITERTRSSNGNYHHHEFDSCDDDGALDQILQQMGRNCKEEEENDPTTITNTKNTRVARPFDDSSINNNNGYYYNDRFLKLPRLESPKSNTNTYHPIIEGVSFGGEDSNTGLITNWAALDRLVASQLNGQNCFNTATPTTTMDPTMGFCSGDHDLQLPTLRSSSSSISITLSTAAAANNGRADNYISATQDNYTSEIDLWSFARSTSPLVSSSEPLCHVSNTSSV